MTILDLLEQETPFTYRKKSVQEYTGPCPFCQEGEDRFCVWPEQGRYWCRVCQAKGDAIQLLRDYKQMGYREACEYLKIDCGANYIHHNHHNHHNDSKDHNHHNAETPLLPPSTAWLENAWPFLAACQESLWSDTGARALAWLEERGLSRETIGKYGLGYNAQDTYAERITWGLPTEVLPSGKPKGLWLPRGVVIPWIIDGELWGLRTRRPTKPGDDLKYYWLPGGTANTLYNADAIVPGQPAVLTEGEIDALTICQAGSIGTATGSTHGARRPKWVARLSTASVVLVAYDSDAPGETAAAHWVSTLKNARRWRPYWSDANQLQQDGVNISQWIKAGIGGPTQTSSVSVEPEPVELEPIEITPVEPVTVPTTRQPQLPRRYYELIGRPLLQSEAAELRLLAVKHGVSLEWQKLELN